MAKFLPLHGDLSGSIGDNTYAHNLGGAYVRRRSHGPTNPTTASQTLRRTALTDVTRRWSTVLTDAERQQWRDWATSTPVFNTLGQPIKLSGHQWFCRCNLNLLITGQAFVTTPPIAPAPAAVQLDPATAVDSATQAMTTLTWSPDVAGSTVGIWQNLPTNVGRNNRFRDARFIVHFGSDATPVATTPLAVPVSAGQLVTLWACVYDDQGFCVTPSRLDVIAG